MKEVLVTKLDKDDIKEFKELREAEYQIHLLTARLSSMRTACWNGMTMKHGLAPGIIYYSDGKAIYKQSKE